MLFIVMISTVLQKTYNRPCLSSPGEQNIFYNIACAPNYTMSLRLEVPFIKNMTKVANLIRTSVKI